MRTLLFLLALLVPSLAFATDPATMPVDLDWSESLRLLVQALGGLKGAGALTVAAAVTQGVMILARSPLGNFAGKFKLLVYTGVSMVAGVLALKLSGVDWLGALMHATTLTAVGTFVNQCLKQASKSD